jgi:hypothetical protein
MMSRSSGTSFGLKPCFSVFSSPKSSEPVSPFLFPLLSKEPGIRMAAAAKIPTPTTTAAATALPDSIVLGVSCHPLSSFDRGSLQALVARTLQSLQSAGQRGDASTSTAAGQMTAAGSSGTEGGDFDPGSRSLPDSGDLPPRCSEPPTQVPRLLKRHVFFKISSRQILSTWDDARNGFP